MVNPKSITIKSVAAPVAVLTAKSATEVVPSAAVVYFNAFMFKIFVLNYP